MLLESNLPKKLWTYAVMTAAVIRNGCYNRRVGQTPHHMLTGKKPNLSKMTVFGSVCYTYKQEKKKKEKCSGAGRSMQSKTMQMGLKHTRPDALQKVTVKWQE